MMSLVDVFFAFAVLIISFVVWWYWTIPKNLPPGPKGLPLLGNSLKTWRASTLPDTLMDWKKEYGPIYKLYIGETLVIVLADWNLIHEAMIKQGDAYAGRPNFDIIIPKEIKGLGLMNSEGELWKTQRRFALSTLRDFGFGRPILEPRIKDEAEYLLEAIMNQNGNAFDLGPLVQNAVSNVICALVFGRRFQYDDEKFNRLLQMLRVRLNEIDVSFFTPFILSPTLGKLLTFLPIVKFLRGTNEKFIQFLKEQTALTLKDFNLEKGDEPTNYIQAFYKTQRDEGNWTFTNEQLIASVGNLFVAGTDTTATTIRWAILFMAHYPEIQEKIYQEIRKETGSQSLLNYADRVKLPFTEATIMEIQRIANLVPTGVMRRTQAPSKLNGYDIPVGTVIAPFLTSTLMDPDVYPNPQHFDPYRFFDLAKIGDKASQLTHLIPFQAGKRVCLGEPLARMELFIFFTALVSRYKFSFPLNEPKPPMQQQPTGVLHAPPRYKICAEPRVE